MRIGKVPGVVSRDSEGRFSGTPVGVLQPCCFTTTRGVADSRCPTVAVMGFPLPGCCRPNGLCGVDLQVISLGCNDPVTVGGMPASRCGGDNGQPPAYMGTSATATSESTPPGEAPAD